MKSLLPALLFCLLFAAIDETSAETHNADVIVYGGTSAGVIAAVQAKRMGKSVIIVGPDKHLGGLSSGGLGWTDTGNKKVIGGLSRDFYHRIWKKYQDSENWRFQTQQDFGGRGLGSRAADGVSRTMWIFEPRIAEQVFEDFVRENQIPVFRDEWLRRKAGDDGVLVTDGLIRSIAMKSGEVFHGKMFIDATYEGDLMASAKVDYHVGREGQEVYGEKWNGVQVGVLHHRHHFDAIPAKVRIDPYITPGDPASGVIPRISQQPPGEKHSGDDRIQAYCFRMCLTNRPENRIPFAEPDNYDPNQYELLVRIFDAGWRETFDKFDPIPNHKTDTNNHGPMSTDNIGMNYGYPEGSYEERRAIIKEHEEYQKGWLYFIANDPRVPEEVRKTMQKWGLPKDEFTDNGNWSHQLYIREARRMVGQFVMTENELERRKPTPQPIGMGSYTMDSHNVQRYITPEGYVQNEGDIGVKCQPYQIAYGSLIPRKEQCQNLLVPVCVSSSHIAFGSIRMEPVFMILGESAATAACLALDSNAAVQEVDYEKLRDVLVENGQVLEYEPKAKANAKKISANFDSNQLGGIVVDDADAVRKGRWVESTSHSTWLGASYRHDGALKNGTCSATFGTDLPEPGHYEVRLIYPPNKNRASNATVTIEFLEREVHKVNQREASKDGGSFYLLGVFEFGQYGSVTVSNEGADGYVVIDGVQWLPVE